MGKRRGRKRTSSCIANGSKDVIQLRSALAASRLELKEEEEKKKRAELRKTVRKYKKKTVVGGGSNPAQIILPEEIWLMIFKQLDIKSLRSCYNTCHLFRDYLRRSTKDLFLFLEVTPILYQNKYVSAKDLLNCRLVSKSMCHWIDHFLQSRDSWTSSSSPSGVSLVPSVNTSVDNNLSPEILEHARNPFVGRSVKLYLPNPFAVVRVYQGLLFTGDELAIRTKQSLETCGRHIWHLSLSASSDISEKHVIMCLEHCQNLKTLEINQTNLISSAGGAQLVQTISSMNLATLKSLVLTLPGMAWGRENMSFDRFQDALVKRSCGTLEHLRVTNWNADYTEYNWTNLKTLQVELCGSSEILDSLRKLKAENLKKLAMTLLDRNTQTCASGNLQLLLEVIRSFPKLEDLSLDFDDNWKIEENEIIELSPIQPDICSTSVKRLQVKFGYYYETVTYSFMCYFPYLESLQISSNRNEMEKDELLSLRNYVIWEKKNIHKSIAWKILPFLRTIKAKIKESCFCYEHGTYQFVTKPVDFRRE